MTNIRVLHNNPNRRLGGSYKRGVGKSRYDYVMMLCGDGGIPASSLPSIISKIGTADIVIPYVTNLREIKTLPRYLISRSYTRLLNFLSGHKLNYYNGLPVHRRSFLNPTLMTSSGFGIQENIGQAAQVGTFLYRGRGSGWRDDQQVVGVSSQEPHQRFKNRLEDHQTGGRFGFILGQERART